MEILHSTFFEKYWETIETAKGNEIFLEEGENKTEFLRWLSENKNVVFHGSGNSEITKLEPRQANCASKKSGNQIAVYAIKDPILPQFYAIKNKNFFNGMAQSGRNGKEYHFKIEKEMLEQKEKAFTRGFVYILDANDFERQLNDNGTLCGEWASFKTIIPLAKLEIKPQEFPYFDDICEYKPITN